MKPEPALIESLQSVPLFGGLTDKALAGIAAQMSTHDFSAGHTVITEDESGRFGRLYVILDGTAAVSIADREVATYGPGDYFGEMSVLDGNPRSATVTATSNLRTMGLSSWNMRALVKEQPDIGMHLIGVLVGRLRATDARFND
jgi:CRP/FNR family transcriptional regulator, cyclic AMP receptor protein